MSFGTRRIGESRDQPLTLWGGRRPRRGDRASPPDPRRPDRLPPAPARPGRIPLKAVPRRGPEPAAPPAGPRRYPQPLPPPRSAPPAAEPQLETGPGPASHRGPDRG